MELEIKVLRGRGLTAFNFFQKLTLYCAVSIISNDDQLVLSPEQKQEQKTQVDEDGDGDPEWNYTMKFDLSSITKSLDSTHFSLLFEFRHHAQFFPDRNIGEVRVPLKDLIDSVGYGAVRFPSYEVRSPDGKHNGVLDFSYKVIGDLGARDFGRSDSRVHVRGYVVQHQHHQKGDPEKIEYPNIGFDDGFSGGNLVPSLAGGGRSGKFQYYQPPPLPPPQPSSNDATHYSYPPPKHENEHFQYHPPPASVGNTSAMGHYPPPSYPPAGPAHPPAHYLSPFSQSVVYPPPHPTPYGGPYWGYHRPAPPDHQHSSHGYEHRHW